MKLRIMLLAAMAASASLLLSGCGSGSSSQESSSAQTENTRTEVPKQTAEAEENSVPENETQKSETSSEETAHIRIGGLKGPTSMGLVRLMDRASREETGNAYEFTMAGAADELVGKIATGDLDIALIPANVASVLYSKTGGQVAVVDINTLGVLYVVSSDDSISSMSDLAGKTVYMTGKGTTPEYTVNYLLSESGLNASDVDLQFKSEATEVASLLKEDSQAIGILPQPFATAACIQNPDLKQVIDLTEEWNLRNESTGSMLITGVTLVRREFLEENEAAINLFLEDHQESASYTSSNLDEAAQLVAEAGIVEKAAIAKEALPRCNIVCITGQEMTDALSGYLEVLCEQDAASVGGQLPGDDFYYTVQP